MLPLHQIKPAANDAPPPRPRAANTSGKVAAELTRQGANLKLSFAFTSPTAAAVFNRADTLWIVFDSNADIDLSALDGEASRTIRGAEFSHAPDADIVRIKLDHPHLASVDIDGATWTVQIGDAAINSTRALTMTRNLIGPNRSSVTIPFDAPHLVHRLDDPDAGDTLMVVTAFAPARGFLNERDFVEFRMLASAEGVVVDPLADDVKVELAPDKIIVSRPMGLALSTSLQTLLRGSACGRRCSIPSYGVSISRPPIPSGNRSWSLLRRRRPTTSAWRRGSIWRASMSPATCIPRPRACSTSRSPTTARPRSRAPQPCYAR